MRPQLRPEGNTELTARTDKSPNSDAKVVDSSDTNSACKTIDS